MREDFAGQLSPLEKEVEASGGRLTVGALVEWCRFARSESGCGGCFEVAADSAESGEGGVAEQVMQVKEEVYDELYVVGEQFLGWSAQGAMESEGAVEDVEAERLRLVQGLAQ